MPNRRADDQSYTLMLNASATGAEVSVPGGEYMLLFDAASNTGTTVLQIKSPSGAWIPVSVFSGSLVQTTGTLLGQCTVELGACTVRMAQVSGTLTGGNAYLVGVG